MVNFLSFFSRPSENFQGHGSMIVEKLGMDETKRVWRKHFMETMEPKFMPEYWAIDPQKEKDLIEYNRKLSVY